MKTAGLSLLLIAASLPIAVRAAEPDAVVVATANPWDAIKDYTYQKRADFRAGTGVLVEKVAAQIKELKEKRATLPETSEKDWDFAMKDLTEAEALLKSSIADLGDATSETWSQAKERVGTAWQRTQTAYDKVKASTTT